MSLSPITKKLMIESQSGNGKCYLRLISMLPSFKTTSAINLEHSIIYMAQNLGQNPLGTRIIPELYIVEKKLSGDLGFGLEEDATPNDYNQFMNDLFNTTMRYTWEEMGVGQHIAGYIDTEEVVPDVYTIQGYSARFVLCMIINPGVCVGVDETYSNLFAEIEEIEDDYQPGGYDIPKVKDVKYSENLARKNEELEFDLSERLREVESLNEQMRDMQRKINKTSMHRRSPDVDEETIKKFSELFMKQTEIREKSPTEDEFPKRTPIEHLRPEDSSSNVGRYKDRMRNRYLEDGTIFNVRGDGKTQLSTHRVHDDLRPNKDVVVGFKTTADMLVRERGIYKRVTSINGLANPFHSHRLNFLCHFDTAIRSVQIRRENHTYYDTIIWISNNKSQSPSQELLFQVVINTFDLSEKRIVANPYKLPFLEIGMLLSDDCLAKCFALIRLEFKSLWFDKMKSLMVPEFHNEFINYKDYRLTSNKGLDPKHVNFDGTVVPKSRAKSSSSKKKGSTILSLIRE